MGQLGEILGGVKFPWCGSLPPLDDFPLFGGRGQIEQLKYECSELLLRVLTLSGSSEIQMYIAS